MPLSLHAHTLGGMQDPLALPLLAFAACSLLLWLGVSWLEAIRRERRHDDRG